MSHPPRLPFRWQLAPGLLRLVPFIAMGLASTSHGQETIPGFADVIDVRLVNLEVVVEDKQGNRITGLGVDDFVLEIDGESTRVEFFSEIANGIARTGAGDTPGVPVASAGELIPTNYLVFVDDFFSLPIDRNRVLDNLAEQLSALGPKDRVAMVAFDGRRLDLLTGWTGDAAEIREAIQEARKRKAFGTQRFSEMSFNDIERNSFEDMHLLTVERIEAAGGEAPPRPFQSIGLDGPERAYAFRLTSQLEQVVYGAMSALRSFAAPTGRKVMLLMSGGWPFDPGEFTVSQFTADVTDAVHIPFFSRHLFSPLIDTANLLGYTLYPVDIPGQRRQVGFDATDNTADIARRTNTGLAGSTVRRELQVHATLDHLAKRTGGKALLNSLRDESLALAIEDTRSFYWLGFTPKRLENDEEHSVEVRIAGRPDLVVRTRDSFVDLSRSTEITMIVESALLFGDPPSARPLDLKFGKPQRKLGKMQVPLEGRMVDGRNPAHPDRWSLRQRARDPNHGDGQGRQPLRDHPGQGIDPGSRATQARTDVLVRDGPQHACQAAPHRRRGLRSALRDHPLEYQRARSSIAGLCPPASLPPGEQKPAVAQLPEATLLHPPDSALELGAASAQVQVGCSYLLQATRRTAREIGSFEPAHVDDRVATAGRARDDRQESIR